MLRIVVLISCCLLAGAQAQTAGSNRTRLYVVRPENLPFTPTEPQSYSAFNSNESPKQHLKYEPQSSSALNSNATPQQHLKYEPQSYSAFNSNATPQQHLKYEPQSSSTLNSNESPKQHLQHEPQSSNILNSNAAPNQHQQLESQSYVLNVNATPQELEPHTLNSNVTPQPKQSKSQAYNVLNINATHQQQRQPQSYNVFSMNAATQSQPQLDQHPCLRDCVLGAPPMTCRFKFNVEHYHSLSKACYDCPRNSTDCDRPHCIMADGFSRSLMVVNRQMPGPSVEVCQGDIVSIDVVNHLSDASTTIHWHGQHQRGTPYMDGVPYVTQCPIPPTSSFRYRYVAATAGTHFWHSHTGCQRADGVFGSLIVRKPRALDPHRSVYDTDLPAHTVQLLDWGHEAGVEKFLEHHHAAGDNKPVTLLVNGRGKFHDATVKMSESHTFLTKFTVNEGIRHRFRLINAGILNCPIQLSVDNHTLLVIASDGNDISPVEASSLVSYAGERFDFVISANQPVGNYWMRFRGLMDCDERFRSAHQVAVLHYAGAEDASPPGDVTYEAGRREGLTVNALNAGIGDTDTLLMPQLNATVDDDVSLKQVADFVYYISYDFYALDNSAFHNSALYGFHQVPNKKQRLYTPQLNHITMRMPSAPPLSQPGDLDPATVCNASTAGNCTQHFCECVHMLRIPLNAVVELVLIDKGVTFDANHPFHLHGSSFRVVAMDRLGSTTSVEHIRELDRLGLVSRKLHRAPVKDTVNVPDGGYTIIRFLANNPGVWLFHCHIEFHAEIGMALALQVGEPSDWAPVPHDFPKCGSYLPDDEDNDIQIEVVNLGNFIATEVSETLSSPALFSPSSGSTAPASVHTLVTIACCVLALLQH